MSGFKIKIRPFGSSGQVDVVEVTPDLTIRQLKDKLCAAGITDTANFRLLLSGRQLPNEQTLSALNIAEGSVLYLINRPEQDHPATTSTVPAASSPADPGTHTGSRPQPSSIPPQPTAADISSAFERHQQHQMFQQTQPVESSFLITDDAPPPQRWYPNQIQTQLTNIWVPENSYNVTLSRQHLVHRLPYSSRLSSQSTMLGGALPSVTSDVEYMSRGFEDELSTTSPSQDLHQSTNAQNNNDMTNDDRPVVSRGLDFTRPQYPIPENVNAYCYPIHLLIQSFSDALPLLESVRDRIANEENITSIEQIEALRYDSRRVGSMLRRFGTAAIDLGSALNHIDFGEMIPPTSSVVGSLSPNPLPGQPAPPFQQPQLGSSIDGTRYDEEPNTAPVDLEPAQPVLPASRPLRPRNPSRLRGPQILHQTMSLATVNPFQMLFGGQQSQARGTTRSGPSRSRRTRSSRSTASSQAPPPSEPATAEEVLPVTGPQRDGETLLAHIPHDAPQVPPNVQMSLPPDFLPVLGHLPLGVPQPAFYQAEDMFATHTAPHAPTPRPEASHAPTSPAQALGEDEVRSAAAAEDLHSDPLDDHSDTASNVEEPVDEQHQPQQDINSMLQAMLGNSGSMAVTSIALEMDPDTGQMRPAAPATTVQIGEQLQANRVPFDMNSMINGMLGSIFGGNQATGTRSRRRGGASSGSGARSRRTRAETAQNEENTQNTSTMNDDASSTEPTVSTEPLESAAPRTNRTRTRNTSRQPQQGLGQLMSMLGPMVRQISQSMNDGDDSDDEQVDINEVLGGIDLNQILGNLMGGTSNSSSSSRRRNEQQHETHRAQQSENFDRFESEDDLPTLLTIFAGLVSSSPDFVTTMLGALMPIFTGTGNSSFDATVLDQYRPTLQLGLSRALRSTRRFYRDHPDLQTPLSTMIYPLFEHDLEFSTELSILVDRTVEPILASLINAPALISALEQSGMNDGEEQQYPITPSINSLIRQLQLEEAASTVISEDSTTAPVDKYLVLALQNMYGPILTELVCYFFGLIRYGAYFTESTTTTTTTSSRTRELDNLIPSRRLLWTAQERHEYQELVDNEALGQLQYLTLALTESPFIAYSNTAFGTTLIALLQHVVGLLALTFTQSFVNVESDQQSPLVTTNLAQSILSFIKQSVLAAQALSRNPFIATIVGMVPNSVSDTHPFSLLLSASAAEYALDSAQRQREYALITAQRMQDHGDVADVERDAFFQAQAIWVEQWREYEESLASAQVTDDTAPATIATLTSSSDTIASQTVDLPDEQRARVLETLRQDKLYIDGRTPAQAKPLSKEYQSLFENPKK